jgi:hypothetical protein
VHSPGLAIRNGPYGIAFSPSISLLFYFYLSPTHVDAVANKIPKAFHAHLPQKKKCVVDLFLDQSGWKII